MTAAPLDVDDALGTILADVVVLPSEPVPLALAAGRVLAGDVVGADDVPSFDNSAMDGYAVRADDLSGASADAPVRLRVVGESRAGAPAAVAVGRGEAVSISTGAM